MSLATRAVYPTQPGPLRQHLDRLLADADDAGAAPPDDLVALVVPDSNRASGGAASAAAYARLRGADLDTVVLISPSHTGAFGRLSICKTEQYHTPLGPVPINDHLRNELCDEDDDIYLDDTGHYHTEGADVQLPFLQMVLDEGFSAVPIVMGEESPAYCRELGAAVGEVMYAKQAVVVGSCDVLSGGAEALGRLRTAIEAFNESELMHLLGSETVQVEGMGALVTTLIAAQRRGATRAEVLALEPPSDDAPGVLACALWRA
ncbi:AmmeMemoRadiSam system protein B [Rubrivirga sp. S365]|uniref:AmmeMemoRadiSam system protein B n=1 Tax=Rubrivirga sp. S365 TaxID=3076080 RepID=UPI0028C683A2|nr:AmmeMemoRadiSam system protein B [Rubrivirga sp. S365]MDT7856750.1 AmmeMemoRadiSam system protein B [Rubrivirga sp. S365]